MEYHLFFNRGGKNKLPIRSITNRRITRLMLRSIPIGNLMGLVRMNQKTKGLIFNEEKKTIRSWPERNLRAFFGEWLSKICRTWTRTSFKSRCGKTKDCKLITSCFSREKTKLSVNWILLSKSSQQHLALNWSASCCQRWTSVSACSSSWSRQCIQWSATAPKLPVRWWSSVQ